MLIHISTTCEYLASVKPPALSEVLNEILRAHRLGHHIVIIERDVSEWIKVNVPLNSSELNILKRITSELTQSWGLVGRSKMFVRLVDCVKGEYRKLGAAIEIPILDVSVLRILERPLLLVENAETDGEIYKLLLKRLHSRLGIPSPQFDVDHGGGSSLLTIFRMRVKDQRIVAAIFDSDMKHPDPKAYDKANEFSGIQAAAKWPFCFWFTPPCHEVENIIPLDVIRVTKYLDQCGSLETLLKISDIEKENGELLNNRFWLFFDTKKGLNPDIYEKLPSEAAKNWVREKMELCGLDPSADVLVGFGERIVPILMAEKYAVANLGEEIKRKAWLDVFREFLEDIMWVLAGGKRIYT